MTGLTSWILKIQMSHQLLLNAVVCYKVLLRFILQNYLHSFHKIQGRRVMCFDQLSQNLQGRMLYGSTSQPNDKFGLSKS